jgi:diguanylate cyclase (GGDEF)-like protein
MDATFIIDRTQKIWYNFYFVSSLSTLFMVLVLYFILRISRQKFRYFSQNILLEEQLSAKVHKLNQILKASQTGYWEWNLITDEHSVDDEWLRMIGLSKDGLTYSAADWKERIHPDDAPRVAQVVANAIKTGSSYVVEFRMRHAQAHYVWIQGSGGITQRGANREVVKLSGTHQDITTRKLLEFDRQKSMVYLSTLFEKNPNIIIVSDGRDLIKVNDAFLNFFSEYDSLEAFKEEHHCISDFFVHQEGDEFVTGQSGEWMEDVLASSEPVVKIRYRQKEYCFSVYAKKVYEQESVSVMVTFNNITEMYRLKKRFEELSILDELTKVHNRRHFNTIFLEEVNRSIRQHHSFCLAILDIDNFKRYNDHYGHDAGDDVLVRFSSEVCKMTQRSNEFFFRLGGEEFGLIFSNVTKEEALEYAQMITRSVEALGIDHEENLPWKKFTISIGVAFIDPEGRHDLKEIYKAADEALYRAKANGRNRVEIS